MTVDPITISTTVVSTVGRVSLYGDIAIVGTGAGGTKSDNEIQVCNNIVEVETYFGEDTNIATAAQQIFNQGVREISCIRAAGTSDTQLKAALDVIAADEDIAFVVLANVICTASGQCAQHNSVIDKADDNNWVHLVGFSGTVVATLQTLGGYIKETVNSPLVVAQSDDDIAAALTGAFAAKKPWDKMMWLEAEGVDVPCHFGKTDVTTFETGSVPMNVMIEKLSKDVVSDGLTNQTTPAASGGTYNYIDITRTRYWLESLIEEKLENLMMESQIPYTNVGIAMVEAKIREACQEVVDDGGITEFSIDMPTCDEIDAADRAIRYLQNIIVNVQLTGHIQTISLELKITI